MRIILVLLLLIGISDSLKVDTSKKKLQMIQIQQKQVNEKLDSIWMILQIDTTLRKK